MTRLLVALALLLPTPAWACKTVGVFDVLLPLGSMTLGPRPTLLAHSATPSLRAVGGATTIAMESVAELSGLDSMSNPPPTAWRPVEPLPAGEYDWFGTVFVVDPELDDVPVLASADFHVTLSEPSGDDDSCGDVDFTRLDIEATTSRDVVALLVELRDPGGDAALKVLVSSQTVPQTTPEGATFELTMFNRTRGFPSFKSHKVCVAVTGVSASGTLSERRELGCANPNEEGPHLTDERGCAGGAPSSMALPLLALVGFARARSRRA